MAVGKTSIHPGTHSLAVSGQPLRAAASQFGFHGLLFVLHGARKPPREQSRPGECGSVLRSVLLKIPMYEDLYPMPGSVGNGPKLGQGWRGFLRAMSPASMPSIETTQFHRLQRPLATPRAVPSTLPPFLTPRGEDRMGRHSALAELRRGGVGRPRRYRHRDAANLRQRDEDRTRQILAGRDVAWPGGNVHTGTTAGCRSSGKHSIPFLFQLQVYTATRSRDGKCRKLLNKKQREGWGQGTVEEEAERNDDNNWTGESPRKCNGVSKRSSGRDGGWVKGLREIEEKVEGAETCGGPVIPQRFMTVGFSFQPLVSSSLQRLLILDHHSSSRTVTTLPPSICDSPTFSLTTAGLRRPKRRREGAKAAARSISSSGTA